MGERRCPDCNKLVAVLSDDFDGSVGLFCQRCKQAFGSPEPAEARIDCRCKRRLHQGTIRQGTLTTHCPRCRVLVMIGSESALWLETPRRLRPKPTTIIATRTVSARDYSAFPRIDRDDELVNLIQARWDARRYEQSRRSVDIAVGLRFDVFARDGFRCRYCGRGPEQGVYLEADHVIPRAKGGPDAFTNLVTACWGL